MKEIKDLNDLIHLVGKNTVDKCFTEYMMLMIAKNNKLDELEDSLKEMNDSDIISVNELKKKFDSM